MKKIILVCLLFCKLAASGQASFVPNIGQWKDLFDYKMDYYSGSLFFERNAITFSLLNRSDLHELHDYEQNNAKSLSTKFFSEKMPVVNGYAYKVVFEGAHTEQIIPEGKKHTYHNYFLGNDPQHWKSRVPLYDKLTYKGLYNGINMKYYQLDGGLKYDLIVAPNADAGQIKLRYEGINPRMNKNGELLLNLGFETVTEKAPYCYQLIDGKRVTIESKYELKDGMIGFAFPQGYDKKYPLIIDPAITYKSFGGSTTYTTGFTNAHDNNGRLCVAGKVLGQGLPVTTGAFQLNYGGGPIQLGDVAIFVFNPAGNQQDYVTFLGGSNLEEPGTIRFNDNNELYVMTETSLSANFPITQGCFDNLPPTGIGGSRSAISVFNASGTQLLGSTFVGGNDLRIAAFELDQNQNVVIGGQGTFPYAFPANAYQSQLTGNSDNILFKLNPLLTQMTAATYLGGNGSSFLLDLVYNKATDEIIAVTTVVFNGAPVTASANAFSNTGGASNIWRFNTDLSQLMAVAQHIDTRLADCDAMGNIYLSGEGDPAVSPGIYSHPTGEAYVKKISPDLSTELLATKVGGTFINAPINMQVTNCGYVCLYSHLDLPEIYVGAPPATDAEFTPNAFAVAPNGSYYYEVIKPDFAGLEFATMIGSTEKDHVHSIRKNATGKGETQYWGTCTESANWWQTPGCAQPNGPAPGSFDVGAIKFNVELPLNAGNDKIAILPNDSICLGDTLFLSGTSSATAVVSWDFGDGTQSNQGNVSHVYTTPGMYKVSLEIKDPLGCLEEVHDSVTIYIFNPENITLTPDTVVCNAEVPLELKVTGGESFHWAPENAVDNPTAPVVHLVNDGSYNLTVTVTHNGGCVSTHNMNVAQYNVHAEAGPDRIIVPGKSVTLDGSASRGANIYWDDNPDFGNTGTRTPEFTPSATRWYYINAEGGDICKSRDSVLVTIVGLGLPNAFSPNGDGLNDLFKLITNDEDNVSSTMQIFNRYGEKVFHSTDTKAGWDGRYKGQVCDLGVYYYSVNVKIGDTEYYFKGDVSLVR